jgi:hypothetical protein
MCTWLKTNVFVNSALDSNPECSLGNSRNTLITHYPAMEDDRENPLRSVPVAAASFKPARSTLPWEM